MKKNGVVRDIEPRMKKVSVEMKKMRKERWSLDSSGDECGRSIFLQLCKLLIFCLRVVAGFAAASASERGVRSKQAAYRLDCAWMLHILNAFLILSEMQEADW